MPLNFLSQTLFRAVKLALEITVTLAMERIFKYVFCACVIVRFQSSRLRLCFSMKVTAGLWQDLPPPFRSPRQLIKRLTRTHIQIHMQQPFLLLSLHIFPSVCQAPSLLCSLHLLTASPYSSYQIVETDMSVFHRGLQSSQRSRPTIAEVLIYHGSYRNLCLDQILWKLSFLF